MKIIVGLGNPGEQYTNTRHNIGFAVADELQKEFALPNFNFNKKFEAEISRGVANNLDILLVKPQTFMNLSGISVKNILDFYKLTPQDIIIIHDDIDIAIGTYKIAIDSRSAGHNGVQNIIDQLGTQKFTRIRIGVGIESSIEASKEVSACRLGAHDFVLGKFSQAEKENLKNLTLEIISAIKNLL